jgi:hypothetical protein
MLAKRGSKLECLVKQKNIVSTSKPLELHRLDLFGPSRTKSLGRNYYGFVIVDDYSRLTWTLFLSSKNDTFNASAKFSKVIKNQISLKIVSLRSDPDCLFLYV